ncbi:hypothetical protein [Dyella caseinilytica]|uniref:Secreted protein n=1 Tax=Dyella caseinilytica TaxID=1849581 RepID=A0ABX7GQ97_9GAMM|nr:hypothetical protein [Dyella caseinilytica]QRN52484.1 hypothetical protein ISN74_13490 [Dyella caseinilytica]GGA06395.1 hypothetical protein GCM10011408_29220 [Dyella caseinilytica]
MHMLLARSAFSRGMQLVAGMLSVVITQDAPSERRRNAPSEFNLVSWTSSARSRREDELARFRQNQAQP